MSRSVKKGPFIHESLKKKIDLMNQRNEKKVVKTWSRASMVSPAMGYRTRRAKTTGRLIVRSRHRK